MKKETLLYFLILLLATPTTLAHEPGLPEPCTATGDCPSETLSEAEQIIAERVQTAATISIAAAAAGLIALVFFSIRGASKKKRAKILLNKTLPYALIWGVAVLLAFSVYYFKTTAKESEGVTVCEAGTCFWAGHTHALAEVTICGEQLDFGLEKGPLGGPHTHKERNLIHFHERLPVDPQTLQITDYTPLKLGTFFNELDIPFNSTCIDSKCNGDTCNVAPGTLSMTVNGEPNTEYDTYVWKDGDQIIITFEQRKE